jgi:pimeloyl-ACP methyl ester carboxylesterase
MDPMSLNDPAKVTALPRVSRLRWIGRFAMRVISILFTNPLKRHKRFRVEDGRPIERFFRAIIYRLALVPVLLVLFLVAIVIAATHPGRPLSAADPRALGIYYDTVNFVADDGTVLEGWLVPAVDAKRVLKEGEATVAKKRPSVVLVHDFAASRQEMLPMIPPLHERGFVVLAVSLRGNGSLSGQAQTFGLNESLDVKAAIDALRARPYVDPARIAVIGVGTGANAALLAARKDPSIAALVVSDPIDGFAQAFNRRVGHEHAWLPFFQPLARLTFQVMYRVDAEDLDMKVNASVFNSRPVLRVDERSKIMQPGTMRNVEHFLMARLGVRDALAGAR